MEMVNSNICRTCLTKQQSEMQPIFKVIDILQKGAAVHISKNDNLPKNICDTCYKRATNAYAFYCQCERSEEILKRTFSDISEYNVFISSNEHLPDIRLINYTNSNNYNCLYSNQCESEFEGVDSIKTINLSSDESNTTSTTDHQLEFISNKNITQQYNDACLMESSCKWNTNTTVPLHNDQRLNTDLNLVYQTASQNVQNDIFHEKPQIETINNPCTISDTNENSNSSLVDLLTVDSCTNEQNKDTQHIETIHDDESLKCKTCDMKFTTKWRLKTHLRTHKNKVHLCQTCGKKFSFHSNLVRHVRIHNGDLPYVCPHCPEKRFAQSNQLKSHLLTHSKLKEHLCNICGVGYARVHALNVHIRRKHSQTALKRIYSCTICSKNYKDISDLSQHMLIHRNARSYVCDLCGKAFNRKNNLKVHELIHRDEKPFQCVLCSKSFRQKHVLESHMNTHKEDNSYQ